MKNTTLEDFRKRFKEEKRKAKNEEYTNGDDIYEEQIIQLEIDINDEFEMVHHRLINHPNFGHVLNDSLPEGKLHTNYRKLLADITDFKEEYDFYDADGELDMMFPDRHDEDFDEDSMSYDSVFGDD